MEARLILADGQIGTTKLTFTFQSFPNAPEMTVYLVPVAYS